MEECHSKPTPLPRSSPAENHQYINWSLQIKKPVPLPRSSAVPMASSSKKTGQEEKQSSESSSFEEVISKGYNTLTQSLKKKIRTASDNVHGKGKAVLETTKNVGMRTERSVRGMLHKHQSTFSSVNSNKSEDLCVKPKIDRCQSLPTENIFSTIKFESPIQQDYCDNNNGYDRSDCASLPPPEYPPPPLPDESLYDELSTKSSHSGSHGDYYTCPSIISSLPDNESIDLYEELNNLKHLSLCGDNTSNSLQSFEFQPDLKHEKSISEHNTFQTNGHNRITVSRSDSWSFYDTVQIPNKSVGEQYVNVIISESGINKISGSADLEHKITPLKPMYPMKATDVKDADTKVKCNRKDSVLSSTGSEASSMSIPNELYLNWKPIQQHNNQVNLKTPNPGNDIKTNVFTKKSFFSEFDPLYERLSVTERSVEARPVDTESLPVLTIDKDSNYFDDDFDTVSLPVPPKRFDSIPIKELHPDIPNDVEYMLYQRPISCVPVESKLPNNDCKPSDLTFESPPCTSESSPSESPEKEIFLGKRKSNLVRWSSMKRAIKKVTESSNWSPGTARKSVKNKEDEETASKDDLEIIDRPNINSSSGPIHSGFLFRSPSGGEKQKDFVQKWCQLAEGKLACSAEKNSSNKDVILVEHIYSLQIVRETRQSSEGEDIYCMEISCSLKEKPYFVGSPGTTERRIWMQKLIESLTLVFPPRLTADYTRAGWCYLKEGITGAWIAAWLLLHKRTLFFCPSNGKVADIDLRKARSIVLQDVEENQEGEGCVRVAEKGPLLRVDCPNSAYYLQMNVARETRAWCRVLREAAVDNGPLLHDQQLTTHDLPIIIEKCINFVYAHGSMSEGIYRRSGSNTNVSKLLTLFQKDAWAVQITRNEYTEHDVASVLKRFFRDLPEPLLTTSLHKVLCNAAGVGCSEAEKVALYRSLLEKLPPINYVTTRRLMGHLHHIHQQCERNLMPVENLASIWGPTLMHIESQQRGMDANWSKRECQVVSELISLYPQLFDVGGAELAREQRIQAVLERYHASSQLTAAARPSGDIKVWVYIGSRDSDCISVAVSPQREALDVCLELCPRMNVHGHELCLLESVLGGALLRPLHHTERVLDTVLRWGYWDDADCKDNCLILVLNTIIRDIHPLAKAPVTQCGELRFADLKSKNFKSYLFEFSQAKLCYYKDKMGSIKLGEWKIEDIVWYIGHEPKRNPRTRWCLTFINKNDRSKRSKENPYFGYSIAGTTRDEQLKWMAAMLMGEYPQVDLLPKPQLNLME